MLNPNVFLRQYCDVMKVEPVDEDLKDFLLGFENFDDKLVLKLVEFTGFKKEFWINARERYVKQIRLNSLRNLINEINSKDIWRFEDYENYTELREKYDSLRKELYEF